MENFTSPIVIVFYLTVLVEFYFFGMQRTVLLISRKSDISYNDISYTLLPKWYAITWLFRIGKYTLLIVLFFLYGWQTAIILVAVSVVFSLFIPIPYKLYIKMFKNKLKSMPADCYFDKLIAIIDDF